jgi:hypothetical protein
MYIGRLVMTEVVLPSRAEMQVRMARQADAYLASAARCEQEAIRLAAVGDEVAARMFRQWSDEAMELALFLAD